jgi:hydrogenase expression/formation protein HypD
MPCAVAGFEPLDLLSAIAELVHAAVTATPTVVNSYGRSVRPEGNPIAQAMMTRVFEIGPARWRGFGEIPASGLALREAFAPFDAARRFPIEIEPAEKPTACRCGEVLRGLIAPPDCALFRRVCTPRNPVGPCMVSAEGACAAYFKYEGTSL